MVRWVARVSHRGAGERFASPCPPTRGLKWSQLKFNQGKVRSFRSELK